MQDYQRKKATGPAKKWSRFYFNLQCIGKGGVDVRRVFPNGFHHLLITSKGSLHLTVPPSVIDLPVITIGGQFYPSFDLRYQGDLDVFGMAFQPTYLYKYMDFSLSHLTGRFVNTGDLLIENPNRWIKEFERASFTDRSKMVDDLFASFSVQNTEVDWLDAVIKKVENSSESLDVGQLRKELQYSRRYFEQKFKKVIGLSPGKYLRVKRFFAVLKDIEDGKSNIEALARDHGYFDHSHLEKDFKSLMRLSFRRYMDKEGEVASYFLTDE